MPFQVSLEDEEIEAQQDVKRHLGRTRRQKRRRHMRCIGVGIGQPDMQRKNRGFQRKADRDKSGRGKNRSQIADRMDPQFHVREIQRSGHHVDQADTDQVKRRPDRSHDQVLEHGRQGAAVRAAGNQHVTRQRRDLHEHENIKCVGRHQDARQTGEREQPGSKEIGLAIRLDLGIETLPAAYQRDSRSTCNYQQQQCTQCIDS